MKAIRIVLSVVFALLSVNVFADAAQEQYKQYYGQLATMRDSGKITSVEMQQRARKKSAELFGPEDRFDGELWSYRLFLAAKRDQGMSFEEAARLLDNKIAEIDARRAQSLPSNVSNSCRECLRQKYTSAAYCKRLCR